MFIEDLWALLNYLFQKSWPLGFSDFMLIVISWKGYIQKNKKLLFYWWICMKNNCRARCFCSVILYCIVWSLVSCCAFSSRNKKQMVIHGIIVLYRVVLYHKVIYYFVWEITILCSNASHHVSRCAIQFSFLNSTLSYICISFLSQNNSCFIL